MGIRWRVAVVALQLVVLLASTFLLTGHPISASAWFSAGMLSVVLNPQLTEPFFTRPVDVLAHSIVGIFFFFVADRSTAPLGWGLWLSFMTIAGLVSLVAILAGSGRSNRDPSRVGRAAASLMRKVSSRWIYSGVFLLSALSEYPTTTNTFWHLTALWLLILFMGAVNWQALFGTLSGTSNLAASEGTIGPTRLLVSAPQLPPVGSKVAVASERHNAEGLLLNRIARESDVWGEVLLDSPAMCEQLSRAGMLTVTRAEAGKGQAGVGVVLEGSTDDRLQFLAAVPLEVGRVVRVSVDGAPVLYQIRWAEIERASVRGGAHDIVRAFAAQLGRFDPTSGRIVRYRWVPTPGACVHVSHAVLSEPTPRPGFKLGDLIGTEVPVFLDLDAACEGHVAILGMTRMGKTSLAARLATELSKTRRVTVVDITGEWIAKRGFAPYSGPADDDGPGISVWEPKAGAVAADQAVDYLSELANRGYKEYKAGDVVPRVLLIDEAHQFVPEPALLGFGGAGRESAQKFSTHMMQVRKYGITIILISQRTAVVAKSALSQCETLLAFKSVDQTGLEFLEAVLGSDAKKALPALRHAEALVFGPAVTTDATAAIRVSTS